MIKVKISNEMFCDLFTPDVMVSHKCIQGLPGGCFLENVEIPPLQGLVILSFHDGKEEITETKLTYHSEYENVK